MIAIPLFALLLIGAPQDFPASTSTPTSPETVKTAPRFTPEQQQQIKQKEEQFRLSREPEIKEAERLNELAANLHSKADARKLVDAVAELLTRHRHLFWAGQRYRHRVAHVEFAAASDPAGLIPEERIVEVWNEYVRDIDAPEEALITVAELHNFRMLDFRNSQREWEREMSRSIWSMPNIYALDSTGGLAEGCRALESLKIINNLHEQFFRVHVARQRVESATPNSNGAQKKAATTVIGRGRLVASPQLRAPAYADPIRPAVARYQQEHGQHEYDQLVRLLFDELLPPGQ
jgi:hypothetical protein